MSVRHITLAVLIRLFLGAVATGAGFAGQATAVRLESLTYVRSPRSRMT